MITKRRQQGEYHNLLVEMRLSDPGHRAIVNTCHPVHFQDLPTLPLPPPAWTIYYQCLHQSLSSLWFTQATTTITALIYALYQNVSFRNVSRMANTTQRAGPFPNLVSFFFFNSRTKWSLIIFHFFGALLHRNSFSNLFI